MTEEYIADTPPKWAHQHAILDLRHHLGAVLNRYKLSDTEIETIVMEVFPK